MNEINVCFVGLKLYEKKCTFCKAKNVHFVRLKMYKKCTFCKAENVRKMYVL